MADMLGLACSHLVTAGIATNPYVTFFHVVSYSSTCCPAATIPGEPNKSRDTAVDMKKQGMPGFSKRHSYRFAVLRMHHRSGICLACIR